ncbi:hypothetical protein JCM16408A_38690 [Methylobacterium phyllosphaerae]
MGAKRLQERVDMRLAVIDALRLGQPGTQVSQDAGMAVEHRPILYPIRLRGTRRDRTDPGSSMARPRAVYRATSGLSWPAPAQILTSACAARFKRRCASEG